MIKIFTVLYGLNNFGDGRSTYKNEHWQETIENSVNSFISKNKLTLIKIEFSMVHADEQVGPSIQNTKRETKIIAAVHYE